jgi:hypothetical protein
VKGKKDIIVERQKHAIQVLALRRHAIHVVSIMEFIG